ncbi:MAG: spermidine synthase family protein, partial [Planctomycetota bacterium]
LSATLTPDRAADLARALSPEAPINRDFSPVLYYYHLRHWMSRFRYRFGVMEALLGLLFVAYLIRIRPVALAVFTTGFAAASLMVVVLLAFQILCGSVYERLGWLVTAFMAGLAVGSMWMNRVLGRRSRSDLVRLEVLVAAFAAGLPVALHALNRAGAASAALGQAALPALSFVLAVLVGMEFPLAGKADFRAVTTTAARIYTADFAGACLGALVVSTFLVPMIGVTWVCLLAAALNAVSGLVLWVTGNR